MTAGEDPNPYQFELEEDPSSMLLDPPDPVDLLIAHTEGGASQKPRPLDFVREKMQNLKKENKRLKDRVTDLEQTLSIVQTAQEWTMGKGMTPEQAEKMREIKNLLEQAKKAREDIQNFSTASRASLYEKLKQCKNALRREREEKREMKERMVQCFHHARVIQDSHKREIQKRQEDQNLWEKRLREMKDRHRRELRRLQGDAAAQESDRQDQLSFFGEQVMQDLSALQQHLREVRQETVDTVLVEGEDNVEDLPDDLLDGIDGPGHDTAFVHPSDGEAYDPVGGDIIEVGGGDDPDDYGDDDDEPI